MEIEYFDTKSSFKLRPRRINAFNSQTGILAGKLIKHYTHVKKIANDKQSKKQSMKYLLHKQIHARVQPFPVVCPRVLAILGNASFGIGLYPLKSKPNKWLFHLLLKITYRWKKQHLLAFPGRDKSTGFTLLDHKQKKQRIPRISKFRIQFVPNKSCNFVWKFAICGQ